MTHIRPQAVVDSALAASDAGTPDRENARVHGVAIKTIRRWRRDYQRRGSPRGQPHLQAECPRCTDVPLAEREYAELYGWYLGDGHISQGRREVYNLHIYNDVSYPDCNTHRQDLMRAVKPASRPTRGSSRDASSQPFPGSTDLACFRDTARAESTSATW